MQLTFAKMRGLGNDFILLDWLDIQHSLNPSALALKLCHRHYGIGADGLMVLTTRGSCFQMRIFNPDGSEAEMCGNAIRCGGKYLWEQGYTRASSFSIDTLSGRKHLSLDIAGNKVRQITVDMGKPEFSPARIPVNLDGDSVIARPLPIDDHRSIPITCVNLGNPHCILFGDNDPCLLGPKIEYHSLFPARTNVEFVTVLGKNEIDVRVWERGVGETLACGSGACAGAIAAYLNDYTTRKVKVHLVSGTLNVHWQQDQHVYMTGPATLVFKGRIDC